MAEVKKKKKKRKKLSRAEKALARLKTSHTKMLRSSFREAGFSEILEMRDFEFKFDAFTSDTDDVFVYENLAVIVERTTAKNPSEHFKKKLSLYQHAETNYSKFIKYIRTIEALSDTDFVQKYQENECIVKIVYCSRFELQENHKQKNSSVWFFDYSVLRYFYALSRTIKKSSLPEFFQFLNIQPSAIGVEGQIKSAVLKSDHECLILSSSKANLPEGFKVVSLYIDAETILNSVYVLRKQGWTGDINAYQRMLLPSKIRDVRNYIVKDGHVFMNNVIITLPSDTKVIENNGKSSDQNVGGLSKGIVSISRGPNTIGVVDGQHRILSFYVGEPFENEMRIRRKKQNLLATAIVFPEKYSEQQRQEFEANLFLKINSTQSAPPPALRLSIETLVDPFSENAIANKVISSLDKNGALQGVIEKYFFETEKLKPSSIVKFQLNHLVRIPKSLSEDDPRPKNLFDYWNGKGKKNLVSKSEFDSEDYAALDRYIKFCAKEVDSILLAVKKNSKPELWSASRSIENRILTTLNVNSVLSCLREILRTREPFDHEEYVKKFNKFTFLNYPDYKSSQYNKMGKAIFQDLFKI